MGRTAALALVAMLLAGANARVAAASGSGPEPTAPEARLLQPVYAADGPPVYATEGQDLTLRFAGQELTLHPAGQELTLPPASSQDNRRPATRPRPQKPSRPAFLPALYGGFVALQVLDVSTTRRALRRGATELNPLLRSGSGVTWGVRIAASAGTMYFTEKLWKKNRLAAVLVMAGINGGYAAIVARNAGR